ncbi:MAG: hypothetical protein U0X58_00835 [Flavobacteriaceae bacterium]
MKPYKITALVPGQYQVCQEDQIIGHWIYPKWHERQSEIKLSDGRVWQVKPKSFWGNATEIFDAHGILAEFKMCWNGSMEIQIFKPEQTYVFYFQLKGFWKTSYRLLNQNRQELCTLIPDVKWNRTHYDLSIETSDEFEQLESKDIILFAMVLCANYHIKSISSAAVNAS